MLSQCLGAWISGVVYLGGLTWDCTQSDSWSCSHLRFDVSSGFASKITQSGCWEEIITSVWTFPWAAQRMPFSKLLIRRGRQWLKTEAELSLFIGSKVTYHHFYHMLLVKHSSHTMIWKTEAIMKAGFGRTGKAVLFPFPLLFGPTLMWKNFLLFNLHVYLTMFCTSLSISHFIFFFCSGLFLSYSSPRDLKAAELWVQFLEVPFQNRKDVRIACEWQTQPILFLLQWLC